MRFDVQGNVLAPLSKVLMSFVMASGLPSSSNKNWVVRPGRRGGKMKAGGKRESLGVYILGVLLICFFFGGGGFIGAEGLE